MKKQIIALAGALTLTTVGIAGTASAKSVEINTGDTLSSIAYENNTSVSQLKQLNGLSSDLIFAGESLKINGQSSKTIAQSTEAVKSQSTTESSPKSSSETLTMVATAYTADCTGCSGITATGIDVRNSTPNVIAVDPNVIPLGSKVWVEGYGEAIAGDTGGAIKGNRIDLLMSNNTSAVNYGVQTVTVKVLN